VRAWRAVKTLFLSLLFSSLTQENQDISFLFASLLRLTPALSQREREIKPNKDLVPLLTTSVSRSFS